jgi:hypothetical protein
LGGRLFQPSITNHDGLFAALFGTKYHRNVLPTNVQSHSLASLSGPLRLVFFSQYFVCFTPSNFRHQSAIPSPSNYNYSYHPRSSHCGVILGRLP